MALKRRKTRTKRASRTFASALMEPAALQLVFLCPTEILLSPDGLGLKAGRGLEGILPQRVEGGPACK